MLFVIFRVGENVRIARVLEVAIGISCLMGVMGPKLWLAQPAPVVQFVFQPIL